MIENYKDDEAIKGSVAVLLMDMIKTDYIISDQERDKFVKIFASYYKMTEAEALELFEKLYFESGDLDLHIAEIKKIFHDTPIQKLTIMKHLNEMIYVDWIVDIEYEKFDKVKNALI